MANWISRNRISCIFGFFGNREQKKISELFEKKYKDQVESELADQIDSAKTLYAKVSRECNDKEIYGVLYYTGKERLNPKEYNSFFYISLANQPATLLERLNNVLYFI